MIIAVIIGVFISGVLAPASGQEHDSIREKLDKIEARLDQITGKTAEASDLRPEISGDTQLQAMDEQPMAERDSESEFAEAEAGTPLTDIAGIISVDESISLEISGFGDVFFMSSQSSEINQDFRLGQVEIDIETTINQNTEIAAAVAYDSEEEIFGLGAFTVDFHLWNSEGGHFRPVKGIDHSGIIAGLFDVPFGLDWEVYPSIDRKLVSAPLVVENTHDCWSDYGIQIYAENSMVNGVVFGSNGFSYDWTNELGEPVVVDSKLALGGRGGIRPLENIELGGSYAGFFNSEDKLDMSMLGADLQFKYLDFSAKGEYIIHKQGIASQNWIKNTGYYVEGLYDFGRYFVVGRYGAFNLDDESISEITRISTGAGLVMGQGSEIRIEYQINSGEKDDVGFLQLVTGF